jgi:hypothetical protein
MYAPGGKPRYRLKWRAYMRRQGRWAKAGNIKSMGIISEESSDRSLELRRSPRNRVAEVVIFLSAYKS